MSHFKKENLDDLPEDWDDLSNSTGIFPLPLEKVLKYFLEEAFQKGGMDPALAVLDNMGDCLKDDE
jgi:hypothetical protein